MCVSADAVFVKGRVFGCGLGMYRCVLHGVKEDAISISRAGLYEVRQCC